MATNITVLIYILRWIERGFRFNMKSVHNKKITNKIIIRGTRIECKFKEKSIENIVFDNALQ